MQMAAIIRLWKQRFATCFRTRSIIILCDSKVKHISISARAQCALLLAACMVLLWTTYSTSGFLVARCALKEQRQALRQVTNARIESHLSQIFSPTATIVTGHADNGATPVTVNEISPTDTTSSARISFLEHKVSELQYSNQSIIQRVQDKTSSRLEQLERIIKLTGLDPEALKKQAAEKTDKAKTLSATPMFFSGKAQGGPYIPASPIELSSRNENLLFFHLDELTKLSQIVSNLPLAMPIHNASEQSPFGHRFDPFNSHISFHPGLDLAGPAGSKIYSTADGKVISAGRSGAYGNMIDIDHGFGITTRYGHLNTILVKEGQTIHKGDLIGIQGSTGRSTGAHLHYEVRYNDQPMNPKNFLNLSNYASANK